MRCLHRATSLIPCLAWLVLAVGVSSSAARAGGEAKTQYLQGGAREGLVRSLAAMSRRYDPEAELIVVERVGRGDYTKLHGKRGHPTRGSIGYAAQLLEANDAEHRERACAIIRRILSLQNTDPRSLTFGLWSWYAEEPLGSMFMVDYNWAAFIGKTLLYIIIHHDEQLPGELRQGVREAIVRACTCIRRRPLHMGYTNIAAMSSYVTLVAGERLGDPKLLAYGQRLFDKWYDYTMLHGSFTEFNSPTYTRVALGVVSKMLADVLDDARRAKAERLNRMLWTHLARRYHEPTGQWAGPHSRAYADLNPVGLVRHIREARDRAGGAAPGASRDGYASNWRHPYRAPADLARVLEPLTEPREEVEVFFKAGHRMMNGMGNLGRRVFHVPIVGTTYLHPRFALGTVSFCDFWEQHRNLMAHWGTRAEPTYLALHCKNGRHGFCSAMFTSVQRRGDVLAAVTFVTDHGNRFIDMDPLPGKTLKTSSLRIAFELGGHLEDAEFPDRFDLDRPFVIEDRGTRIVLRYLGGTLAGQKPTAEIKRSARRVSLVLHLYQGPEKAFHLPTLTEAVSLFAISFDDAASGKRSSPKPKVTRGEGRCQIKWKPRGDELVLGVPSAPVAIEDLQKRLCATLDGAPPGEHAKPLLPGE